MSEQTRRNLLVTISQAAAGWSLSGRAEGETVRAGSFPPGVYAPQTDHLSHALMSADPFHPIVPGCPTDYIRPRTGPFSPLFFSQSEFATIRRLTELLLGEAPQHQRGSERNLAEEVAEWIDLCVWSSGEVRKVSAHIDPLYRELTIAYYGPAQYQKLQSSDPAKICREGLEWMNRAARAQHSKEFAALETKEQIGLLNAISDAPEDERASNAGTRFFVYLKAETARGFYTSRSGLKELDFKGNAFYARSPGCDRKRI